MAARRDGRIADQDRDGKILRVFADHVDVVRMSGHAMLPAIGHTEE